MPTSRTPRATRTATASATSAPRTARSGRGRAPRALNASPVFDDGAAPSPTHAALTSEEGALMQRGYEHILDAFGRLGYPTHDDNFRETGVRAAKAMLELVLPVAEIERTVAAMVERSFPATYDEMVISKHNVAFGLCPHHLLPVIYRVSLAYMPRQKVLGISKLSRLARLLARAPVLQEQLTQDLAGVLHERLASKGSAVYIEGLHLCMAARGTEAHEARVVTSAVRGVFRDEIATRQEFLDLVTKAPVSLI